MAQKSPLENPEKLLYANELFNMAKAATNARREKCIIPIPEKETAALVTEKSVSDDINISEEENTDPQNVDISEEDSVVSQNNSLPSPPLNKKLKRKRHAVINQCFTNDEAHHAIVSKAATFCSSETETDTEDVMTTDDNIEEQVEKLKLNRESVGYKKALATTAFANIHRAPTPARIMNSQENITNDDMRRASSAK